VCWERFERSQGSFQEVEVHNVGLHSVRVQGLGITVPQLCLDLSPLGKVRGHYDVVATRFGFAVLVLCQ
jgi:hypothetical protein